MRNSRLEAQILNSIDEVVQCAISAGLKEGPAREEEIARGASIIEEIGHLLLEVLEGKEEHLKSLVEQLAAQRLPDRRVLQSFGHFSRDLQEIIERGVNNFLNNKVSRKEGEEDILSPEAPPETSESPDDEFPADTILEVQPTGQTCLEKEEDRPRSSPGKVRGLRLALEQAFPGEEIVENFVFRGGTLDYFLPRLNLGFEVASTAPDWRKEFFLRRAGIKVIKLSEGEIKNPLSLARRLRRPGIFAIEGSR
ncbi:MAG: hypothetical protein L5656_01975 [Thermanaeromonas sp.]|uniref:hypothetical protein n=1 Tax=Thermanaeromonas sp. TaxID=2003697 RepID=UPI00243BDBF2|nr:hypothetical protein [Thermanaeromonas sp.]MCG0277292.1 hypothetical protein [Thermanaeromonas sp.]